MKVQIEINESQFKELLEKELTDLPKEDIQKILLESIKSYLCHDDIQEIEEVRSLYDDSIKEPAKIIRKPNYEKLNAFLVHEGGNYYNRNKQPSQLFINILNQCDFSGLQDVVDEMIEDLKNNYRSVLIEAISKRMADSFINDYKFQSELTNIIQCNINMMNANK